MRFYQVRDNRLEMCAADLPAAADSLVLVQVQAIGVNRADIFQIEGRYPSPDGSNVPGLEIAGVRVDNGQRVAALLTSGGYAEYAAVPECSIAPIPDWMSFEEAAAVSEAFAVAELNLFEIGEIRQGQKVLIHGGASGVGHLLVQIALTCGAEVYTTSRDVSKLAAFAGHCHLLSFEEPFDEYIAQHGKVDLVLDILGSKYLNRNISSCKAGAKLVILASMSGRFGEINLGAFLVKNLQLIGSTLRSKSAIRKGELLRSAYDRMLPTMLAGEVKPVISKVFRFEDMLEAHQQLQDSANFGKVVVKI